MARFLVTLAAATLMAATAHAAPPRFSKLPTLDKKAKTKLKLRIVRYTGSTNGGMVVEVKNDSKRPQTFKAAGLFFVPRGNPDDAPQRLGATGPFEVQDDGAWKRKEKLAIAPGQKVKLKLQLFCIDSHRSSPSASTPFRLAKKRLPKRLRQEIESGTRRILKSKKAGTARGARDDVQKHVWKTRNKKWIKLEGERQREK